jgi:hypothetical protein
MNIMPITTPFSETITGLDYNSATGVLSLTAGYIIPTTGSTFLPIGGGTLTGNLLFTDATYDIGASGATRPRHLYLSGNLVTGSTVAFNGSAISASYGINNQFTVSSSTANGIYNYLTNTKNTPVTVSVGLGFYSYWSPTVGSSASRTCTTLGGGSGITSITLDATETKDFTATNMFGYQSIFTYTGSTTGGGKAKVGTRAAHFWATAPNTNINTDVLLLTAFYDAGQDNAKVTTAWGLGINTANSYINGSLRIGSAVAPTVPLDVVGAILNTTTIEAGTGFKCGGTAAVADGTYTVGLKLTPVTGIDGTITVKGGIVTNIQSAT